MFFRTVSRHRAAAPTADASNPRKREPWMWMVMASTLGFLVTLVLNLAATIQVSIGNTGPALGHVSDQRMVTLATWGFLVPAVWGFNARWLPVFLGLDQLRSRFLFLALALDWAAILAEFAASFVVRGTAPVCGSGRRVRPAHRRTVVSARQDDGRPS